MTKMQRDKGAAYERNVVNICKAAGLHAERTAPMQAGNDGHGDVYIEGWLIHHSTFHMDADRTIETEGRQLHNVRAECKHHANYPKRIWTELAGNDVLIVKRTAKPGESAYEHLAILPLSEYLKLIGGTQ